MRRVRWNASFGVLGNTVALVLLSMAGAAMPTKCQAPNVLAKAKSDGFEARFDHETIRVTVCSDVTVHVVATPGDSGVEAASPEQPWMLDKAKSCPGAKFEFVEGAEDISASTAKMRVKLIKKTGNLVFSTKGGTELLRERPAIPRTYEEKEVAGEKMVTVEDRFMPDSTEGLYGLGQHQSGMFNYRGSTVELAQHNTDVAIPLMVSSKGYGLLWNTASFTVADNRYPAALGISSVSANAVDYYFIYGPEMDDIIHGYRTMTGHVPLFPLWAYGFFQSKDSYTSQAEILDVARRYRSEHIPLDCIVQDAGWWIHRGDMEFNAHYPDVSAELAELHAEHFHTMISVWGLFNLKSDNLQILKDKGFEISGTQVYDATNPAARDFFWKILPGPLLAQGWDAFWLDASEPDSGPHEADALLLGKSLAIGSGNMYTNIYPLMHTGGIADHWKQDNDKKRVVLLTRSAFLGQQRNGAAVWSGDVYPTNWAFQHQIAAGLNFALSGMPYWTTDVAGYFPLYPGASMTTPEYQQLYARWFQFGVFSPMFRTHGHRDHNEVWTYDKVRPILVTYDKLRYRLLPYIYSLAWKVTNEDYTIQRPLLMDWRTDEKVWNIADEFMFGPAFLVSPIWKDGAVKRDVYLPQTAAWYDFWTGQKVSGGQDLDVAAPLDKLPLFIRAGSILTLGPEVEYAGEKPAGPVEVRIYRGAAGSFDLYEDEGDGYNYEQGAYSLIPMRWNDAAMTLTIGERTGKFAGMVESRTFDVVLVSTGHGVGEAVSLRPDAVVNYTGKAVSIHLSAKMELHIRRSH